jgi:endonuclease YncB( thermonuclease family)
MGKAVVLGTTSIMALVLVACSGGKKGPIELKDGDLVTVSAVVKGDEVTVTNDKGEARVRLVGVQAFSPVIADPQIHALSAGAVSALEDWVKGKQVKVTLDHAGKDPAGRFLAYLEFGGVDINRRLVETGWAVVYTEFAFDREAPYLEVELAARSGGRNIWALKPASDLVRGLRRQWLTVRTSGDKPALVDPLLQ